MRRWAALALAAALAGCGGQPSTGEPEQLVVFAAASLAGVVEDLATAYEQARPGTAVTVNAGASSTLAQSVVGGAPADVFLAASPETVRTVVDAGEAAGEPVVVARNRLQIAVPRGNPGGVRGLADLARGPLDVALCAPQVPCGASAARALRAAGVDAAPDTLEQDVKGVLAKVRLGEVDAGLVYVTDVRAAGGDVEGIAFAEAADAVNDCLAVVVRGGGSADAARAFVQLLASPAGREAFARAGFEPPP